MLLKRIIAVAAIALFGADAYAENVKVDFDRGIDVKPIIETLENADYRAEGLPSAEAVESSRRPAAPSKEWTIMVFVNGKNNLEQYALKDVNEMETVGSGEKVNIVVELGRMKGYSAEDGDWTGARRYLVQKDTDSQKITSPILQSIPNANMGSWTHLAEFAAWAKTNYPARKYMLIVWNHGSGWLKATSGQTDRGISFDEETRNRLSTQQLGQALEKAGGVDVYGSDACLMQMAEVDYQIKNHARVIVQSAETEPADGYTYGDFLSRLSARPQATPEEAAEMAADSYIGHYAQIGIGATQSVVKAAALEELSVKVREWVKIAMSVKDTAAVKAAKKCQTYYYLDNKDMHDFMRIVAENTKHADLREKSLEVTDFLEKEVVLANKWTGDAYKHAHGLAVYVPASPDFYDTGSQTWTTYDSLAWSSATGWNTFAKWAAGL